ncbi:hypothetical protein CMI47_17620 [Candidatus Pacearchaeota archaeon]|nr:hypothetical protein [Candidatus Pacearchaeota archaeon]|tara:strand:+ start:4245 stop:5162 length:918 start_codon:yes stop_codon:yes gene_type:complete
MKKYLILLSILLVPLAIAATQNVTVEVLPGSIDIFSPIQDTIYTSRQVPINLSMNTNVNFFRYSDNGKRFRTLCRNCDSYGFSKLKEKPFNDGFHNVIILGIFNSGNISHEINFTVDTRDPRITRTEPSRGFALGNFEVEFQEANPKDLTLYYGNSIKSVPVDLAQCTKERSRTLCLQQVNLSEFNGQEIQYWFNITDILGKTANSKIKTLKVDTQAPVINSFNFTIDKRRVEFLINITEPNFNRVKYIDFTDRNPRLKNLCSRLEDGICQKKRSFRKGTHNLTIEITDDVDNKNQIENIVFNII